MRAVYEAKVIPVGKTDRTLPFVSALLFFVIGAFVIPINLFAQEVQTGSFVVYPAKNELEILPGESREMLVRVVNRTGSRAAFDVSVEDIEPSPGESPVTLLGRKVGPYSIQEILSLRTTKVTIAANEEAEVPVTISVPQSAEPGGKYGAVIVSLEDSGTPTGSVAQTVSRIASLFFIRVSGEAATNGNLEWFRVSPKVQFRKNTVDASIGFRNTGNVHVNPYGVIVVSSLFGKEVAAIPVDPFYALPGGLRERVFEISPDGKFGPYKVSLELNRGYSDVVDQDATTVWFLPWRVLLIILFVILILALELWRYKKRRQSR